ncbi:hypothetical protein KI440_02195 [Candidatus Saccharibacteria bacterium TM7i]|nr:hypothetical protein KI440_02195 [Candidatus Saccharibacteria bacterium TM7i]
MPKSRRTRTHKEYAFHLPCEGKNRYDTEKEASDAADFHMLENMNIDLMVYQCAICGYWHMTSRAETNWRDEMPKQ